MEFMPAHMPNFVWPGRETGNQFGVHGHRLIPASLPDIGQSRWKLFSNIMEALLMNCINLTLN